MPRDLVEHGRRRMAIVIGVMLAVLLEILDTTIVNVALPTIQGNLGADFEGASWIVTGYLIAVIVALPLVPWFESVFGRRRYTALAIAGFTLASMACGLSTSLEMLVFFRIVQGLFGGGILTVARSILRDTFPPEKLGASQGLLALGAVVGPSVGPALGGLLTDNLSWRWVFFINMVPGLVSAAILWFTLRDPRRQRVSSDVIGLVALVVGLGSLQYVLESGERHDWFGSQTIVVFAILAAVFTVVFCIWELRYAKDPIVDLRILKRPVVMIGSLVAFALGFTLFVGIVLGPQFTQGILGFTATLSGYQVLVRALAIAAAIPVAVIAMTRLKVHPRYLLALGFAVVGIAGLMMSAATTSVSDFWTFGGALSVGGLGFGLMFVPLSVGVLASVQGSETTKASSMLSLAQQLGASVSTAIMATIIDRRAAVHLSALAGGVTLTNVRAADLAFNHASLQQLAGVVARESVTLGFADANYVGAVLAFLALPVALLFGIRFYGETKQAAGSMYPGR